MTTDFFQVVSSVQSLIRILKGGQLQPSERETVCVDINVFTESKQFEIDIQASCWGPFRLRDSTMLYQTKTLWYI